MTRQATAQRPSALWLVPLALALILVALPTAMAQATASGQILGTSGPLGFSSPLDTYVEETEATEADQRLSADTVRLRGNDTGMDLSDPTSSDDGRRVYLLSLSPGGGDGISQAVRERYAHAQLDRATLRISYSGGCDSADGQLTIRAINTRGWDPASVNWSKTDLDGPPSQVDVQGVVLADQPINAGEANENPAVSCSTATIPLNVTGIKRVLTGMRGGLAFSWTGQQPLTLDTLDAGAAGPRLQVSLQTRAAAIGGLASPDGLPVFLSSEDTVDVVVNATDEHPLPDQAVSVSLTDHSTGDEIDNITAERVDDLFRATKTFPVDSQGLYDLTAWVEDSDGWITARNASGPGPHVVVDDDPPRIDTANLSGTDPGQRVVRDQNTTVPIAFQVTDKICQAGQNPCGTWQAVWDDQVLGQGLLRPGQAAEGNLTLDLPGNATLALHVTDLLGHVNRSTNWTLEVQDIHRPEPTPLQGTLLGPGLSSTVETGTEVPVALAVGDDLPVEVTLELSRGPTTTEHDLGEPGKTGVIRTTLTGLDPGDHAATLIIDDGTHTFQASWGQLNVTEEGAPSVLAPLPGDRIRPGTPLDIQVRDRSLDPNATEVAARVGGLSVTPTVEVTTVTGGQDLTVQVPGTTHGDEVQVTIRAKDTLGNVGKGSLAVKVDAQGPRLTGPSNATWVGPEETLTFTARDPGGGSSTLTVTGSAGSVQGPAPLTVPADRLLPTGARQSLLTVTLTDDLGNQATTQVSVGLDEQAPVLSTSIGADGASIHLAENGSGLERIAADVWIDGEDTDATLVRQGPGEFRIVTGPLTRGQTLGIAAQAIDQAGNQGTLGTEANPHTIVVPDRPPKLVLERRSPAVTDAGQVAWDASDPDGDPINTTLRVTGPDGDLVPRTEVGPNGTRTLAPETPGRYEVSLVAEAHGVTQEATTVLYLGPEGRVTTWGPVPEDLEPGTPLVVTLSFPSPPQSVHVVAKDQDNVTHPAKVNLDGTTATATFSDLPDGRFDLHATVVHEPGATETFRIASVDAGPSLVDQLGGLLVPLLALLALAVLAVVVYVVVQNRGEDDQAADGPPR